MYVTVNVDVDDVIGDIDDDDLLKEVKIRGLLKKAELGLKDEWGRKDDLIRALTHRDWAEVEYLLWTYFLRDENHLSTGRIAAEAAKYAGTA